MTSTHHWDAVKQTHFASWCKFTFLPDCDNWAMQTNNRNIEQTSQGDIKRMVWQTSLCALRTFFFVSLEQETEREWQRKRGKAHSTDAALPKFSIRFWKIDSLFLGASHCFVLNAKQVQTLFVRFQTAILCAGTKLSFHRWCNTGIIPCTATREISFGIGFASAEEAGVAGQLATNLGLPLWRESVLNCSWLGLRFCAEQLSLAIASTIHHNACSTAAKLHDEVWPNPHRTQQK